MVTLLAAGQLCQLRLPALQVLCHGVQFPDRRVALYPGCVCFLPLPGQLFIHSADDMVEIGAEAAAFQAVYIGLLLLTARLQRLHLLCQLLLLGTQLLPLGSQLSLPGDLPLQLLQPGVMKRHGEPSFFVHAGCSIIIPQDAYVCNHRRFFCAGSRFPRKKVERGGKKSDKMRGIRACRIAEVPVSHGKRGRCRCADIQKPNGWRRYCWWPRL